MPLNNVELLTLDRRIRRARDYMRAVELNDLGSQARNL